MRTTIANPTFFRPERTRHFAYRTTPSEEAFMQSGNPDIRPGSERPASSPERVQTRIERLRRRP